MVLKMAQDVRMTDKYCAHFLVWLVLEDSILAFILKNLDFSCFVFFFSLNSIKAE